MCTTEWHIYHGKYRLSERYRRLDPKYPPSAFSHDRIWRGLLGGPVSKV